MTHTLIWNNSYKLGIEEIDLQHHYFINLIARLESELAGAKDVEYINKLLNELVKYTQFHFISEENLMYKIDYPGLEAHRNQHFHLLNLLNGKLGLYNQSLLPAEDVIDFLKEWFVDHTLKEDKKITQYIP
ncbi:MAG: bacteriohemerythrin [Gammaproteobacteria bacterium]|nr:bacteriohemerythrin [Gammaproteobacteria bacterium]